MGKRRQVLSALTSERIEPIKLMKKKIVLNFSFGKVIWGSHEKKK